ncbi:hypothetical protein J6590_072407 [Homalodisca vitripennis]|nr:hypothetical protein J6590_072407 [Homalodisca vitripennis]
MGSGKNDPLPLTSWSSTDIFDAFGERCQVGAVGLDFAKAFDCVTHIHLLDKLKSCGFNGYMLQYIAYRC